MEGTQNTKTLADRQIDPTTLYKLPQNGRIKDPVHPNWWAFNFWFVSESEQEMLQCVTNAPEGPHP